MVDEELLLLIVYLREAGRELRARDCSLTAHGGLSLSGTQGASRTLLEAPAVGPLKLGTAHTPDPTQKAMSSALRIGAKRAAAAAARPAQVAPRRSLHEGQARLLEKRKIFQANPHLHGESVGQSPVGLLIALAEEARRPGVCSAGGKLCCMFNGSFTWCPLLRFVSRAVEVDG